MNNNLGDWYVGYTRISHIPCIEDFRERDRGDDAIPWISYLSGPIWKCPECSELVPNEILFVAKLKGLSVYTIEQPNEQSS